MRHHTRLARWALASALLAACTDGSFEPVVVRSEMAVTTDSSTYHLRTVHTDLTHTSFIISGNATFRNITNRTLYITERCIGLAARLERVDGEPLPFHEPYCVYDYDPPSSPPMAVASGDSIVVPFSFSADVSDSLVDATIPTLIGDTQFVFDVGQHVFGSPQPEPASRAFATSTVFTISP